MDINDFRGVLTAIIFFAFIAISIWAFSRHKKSSFEQNGRIPFDDEVTHEEIQK